MLDVPTGEEVLRSGCAPGGNRHLRREACTDEKECRPAHGTRLPPSLENDPIREDGNHRREPEVHQEGEAGRNDVRQTRNRDEQPSWQGKEVMSDAVDVEVRTETPHEGRGRPAADHEQPAVPMPSEKSPEADEDKWYSDVRKGLARSPRPVAGKVAG